MVKIDGIGFGWIKVDGKKHRHDVVILPNGVVKRRKGGFLLFGSHSFKLKEFEELLMEKPDIIILGTGTNEVATLSEDAKNFLEKARVEWIALQSQKAVEKFNELMQCGRKVAAIIHVTC
ncbi:MAG: MTH938/NDUFAF3 family protein [Candidatus Bathyarchaeia archaeon]